MKMLVVLHLIHLGQVQQDHLVHLVVDHLVVHQVLLLVPLQELPHHLFLQLFHPVEILVAVDANAKQKIINVLQVPQVLREHLEDLDLMDIQVLMALLVLMLKMLPPLIALPPDVSTALLAHKVLLDLLVNLDLAVYLVLVE
jgi:hypothetical protein